MIQKFDPKVYVLKTAFGDRTMIETDIIKASINCRHGKRVECQRNMGILAISAVRLFSHDD